MLRRRPSVLLRLILLLTLSGAGLWSSAAGISEYQLKAVILYNFASFTKWPASAAPGMNFCVLGRDPFGELIDALENKTVYGEKIKIIRLLSDREIAACRLVFISDSESDRLEQVLSGARKRGILTLSDIPGSARRGVMIEIVLEGSRLAFEINLHSVKDAGMELSSRMLNLARKVYNEP
jgi:hypothetical protein